MDIPEEFNEEQLDDLAEVLTLEDLYYIQRKMEQIRGTEFREKIDSQVDDAAEIMAQMTSDGYYDKTIELSPSLRVTFRSISSGFLDDAIEEAASEADDDRSRTRLQNRWRLAYGFLDRNGDPVGEIPFSGSLYELDDVDQIHATAKGRFREISLMPDVLVRRLTEAVNNFDSVLYDRINYVDQNTSEVVKKSTRTPDTAQSQN